VMLLYFIGSFYSYVSGISKFFPLHIVQLID